MKKSAYRIILMLIGLVHAIAFFAVSYAKLNGLLGGLNSMAGLLTNGAPMPESMTAVEIINLAAETGAPGMQAVFVLIVGAGAVTVLLNLLGKGKVSYILSLLMGLLAGAGYGILYLFIVELPKAGYTVNSAIYIMFALAAVHMLVALVGCIKDKTGAAAASGEGKSVKVGKKDGTITGVEGSYTGAVIPIKSGETVIIGRDPSVCSIVVRDEKASRKHCSVAFNGENGMYAVTDTSVNGVYDGEGNAIAQNTAVPMPAGSTIRLGRDGDVFRLG